MWKTRRYEARNELQNSLSRYLAETEKEITSLKKEIDRKNVQIQLLRHKETAKETTHPTNSLHALVYTRNNGEGINTETCIGVFTTVAKALDAQLQMMQKHQTSNLWSQDFSIIPFAFHELEKIPEHCEVLKTESEGWTPYETIIGLTIDGQPSVGLDQDNTKLYTELYKLDIVEKDDCF